MQIIYLYFNVFTLMEYTIFQQGNSHEYYDDNNINEIWNRTINLKLGTKYLNLSILFKIFIPLDFRCELN